MSRINLGSFNQTNGRTTGLGLASGLDSTALIDAILSARSAAITDKEDTIVANKEKITAVGSLKTLLDRFKTTADFLRTPPGVGNQNSDFFKHTTTSLSSSTTTAASTYLSVTSEAGATLATHTISGITLAQAHQIRKDGFTSQTASVVGNASVTDNYQASLGTVSGNVLNSTTPITFAADVQGEKANIDIVFGDQNEFENGDTITFRDPLSAIVTTVAFDTSTSVDAGNTLGIQDDTTLAEKVAHIATHMNSITVGVQSTYTYTASGDTLTVTRDVAGSDSEVETSLTIEADFSTSGTTQTVQIGDGTASNNPANGTVDTNGTDGNQGTTATKATLEMVFGDENKFDATDQIQFGTTTITFGGAGGDDIDISTATTLDDKIDAIVTRMNAVSTAPQNTYTYSRPSTGILKIEQDTAGTLASTGNDMTVAANFSTGTTDTTQTVTIGKNYENNASSSGSVARSNGSISGSVSQNGVDGWAAATKATINVVIANNTIDTNDTITFGTGAGSTATFGVDITVGANLAEALDNITAYYNNLTVGTAAGYKFENDGTNLIVTNESYGSGADLAISADFSVAGDLLNTVKIGTAAALNVAPGGAMNTLTTDGVDQTSVAEKMTTHIPNMSGAITMGNVSYIAGVATTTTYIPNSIEFKATIGGETYTSKPVWLDGGDIDADGLGGGNGDGDGTNGLGNRIPSGTVITFVKDVDLNSTEGAKEVTFQLTVGDEATNIDDATDANTYAASINTWLNTTNTITITQSPTVPEFRAGTFSLGGVDITLEEGDSLGVIKSKINAVKSTSGVVADIIQVSDTSFSLTLKSNTTGTDNKILEFGDGDPGDGPTGFIQIGLDNVEFTETQAAGNAAFTINGQAITRQTNTINDVIDKLTFSLLADTPTGTPPTLTLNVQSNTELVKSGVTDFVTAYNELRFFISEQTQRDENGDLVETAILGDESVLRDVLTAVERQLTRAVSGISSGKADTLFDAGIDLFDFPGDDTTPETKDIFIIDDAKFDAAIAADFEAFRDVFTFTFTANSPDISIFSRTNNVTLTDFKLDIDSSRAIADQVRVLDPDTDAILFYMDASGNSITGQAGTALEGLSLVYSGDGTDVITVNATRGIADSVYNVMEGYMADDGFIDDVLNEYKTENDRLQERIDKENEDLIEERELLVSQFTLLEAVISQANSTLDFLQSQRDANNNSN